MCACLDIEGAFDNASHDAVQAALSRRGLDLTTSRWIISLLRSRQATATVQDTTVTVTTTRGCAQGGVLSPLLWSLFVDELLRRLAMKVLLEFTPFHTFIRLQIKATLLRMAMEGVGN